VKIDQCHRSAEQTAGVRSARIANIPAAHQPQSREQVREQPVHVYRKAAFSGATVPKWSALGTRNVSITSNRGGGFQSSPLHTYYMEDTIAPGSLSVICHPAEVVLTPTVKYVYIHKHTESQKKSDKWLLCCIEIRNLNFGRAVSLEMLQVTIVRADTSFQ